MNNNETLVADMKHTRKSVDEMQKFLVKEFDEVKGKQDKTNGRVTALEVDKIKRDVQVRIIGYALTVITGITVAVTTAWFLSRLGLK